MADERPTNRLARARSPYLREAAHQPVDWHEWGAEAFERARREDKPVLLDVGATWCHWCHVMDHESYESEEIARVINERFVAVKVDRDERPDVDTRYQKLVGAITGQGGWPLTGFLTPDGNVFYGGTYFPPRDAHGRPGFPRVLESVSDAYRNRRDEVHRQAQALTGAVADRVREMAAAGGEPGDVTDEGVAAGVDRIASEYDAVNGGFGDAPKFPHPSAITLLVRRATRDDPNARLRDVVVGTLDGMARGGMRDHVGGGFHRYSVDAEWIVPHFEKMLYDNAELLRNYALASRAFPDSAFDEAARETVRFLRDVLGDADRGGFGGSQDADVGPGDDGDYFTWTLDELKAAVPDATTARVVAMRFGVEEHGDMHHNRAKNVLHVEADVEDVAKGLRMDAAEVTRRLAEGMDALRAARAERKAPFVDPTAYVGWNGMAASALLWHAGAEGDRDAADLALRAVDRMVREAYADGKGFARVAGAPDAVRGILEDNANMLQALIDAHDRTGNEQHLLLARDVADLVCDEFWSEDEGAFLTLAPRLHHAAGPALAGEPAVTDNPSPSAGGVAMLSLLRLEALTGIARYGDVARRAVKRALPQAQRYGLFGAQVLLAADAVVHPGAHVVIVAARPDAERFRDVALAHPDPARVVTVAEPGAGDAPVPEAAADLVRSVEPPVAVVCVGTRCLAPARSPEELADRLRTAHAPGGGA